MWVLLKFVEDLLKFLIKYWYLIVASVILPALYAIPFTVILAVFYNSGIDDFSKLKIISMITYIVFCILISIILNKEISEIYRGYIKYKIMSKTTAFILFQVSSTTTFIIIGVTLYNFTLKTYL